MRHSALYPIVLLVFPAISLAQKTPPPPGPLADIAESSAPKIEYSFDKNVVQVTAGELYSTVLKVKDADTWREYANDGSSSLKVYPSSQHAGGYLPEEIRGGQTEADGWAVAGYSNGEYTYVHTKRAYTVIDGQPITATIMRKDRYRITDSNTILLLRDINSEGGSGGTFYVDQTILISPRPSPPGN